MFPGEVTCVTRTLMSLRQVGRLRLGFSSSEAGGGVGTTDRTSSSNGGSQTVVSKGWASLTWILIKQEKMNMEKNEFYSLAWMSEQEGKKRKRDRKNKKQKEKQKERWSRCFFGLFTTYCLLETARPFLTSMSSILVPGKSSPISYRHTGTGLVLDSE